MDAPDWPPRRCLRLWGGAAPTPRVGSPFIALAFRLSLPCPAASPAAGRQWRGATRQRGELGGGGRSKTPPTARVRFLLQVQVAPQQQSLAAGRRMAGTHLGTATGSGLVPEAVGACGEPSPQPISVSVLPLAGRCPGRAPLGPSSSRPLLGRCLRARNGTGLWLRRHRARPSGAGGGSLGPSLPPFALHYIHFFFSPRYRLKPRCWRDRGSAEPGRGKPPALALAAAEWGWGLLWFQQQRCRRRRPSCPVLELGDAFARRQQGVRAGPCRQSHAGPAERLCLPRLSQIPALLVASGKMPFGFFLKSKDSKDCSAGAGEA